MSTAKRVCDVACAVSGLIVLSPLFVAVAFAVFVEDPGNPFFGQERVGGGGRPFRLWKFRSMCKNAELVGAQITVGGDPRITRVGRVIRTYKLDELPQLLNVLLGEMSLVGPRPEVQRYVDLYTSEQRQVLKLRPGITDPASIRYRNESERLTQYADPLQAYVDEIMPEKIRINLAYAARATLRSDLRVILATLGIGSLKIGPSSTSPTIEVTESPSMMPPCPPRK